MTVTNPNSQDPSQRDALAIEPGPEILTPQDRPNLVEVRFGLTRPLDDEELYLIGKASRIQTHGTSKVSVTCQPHQLPAALKELGEELKRIEQQAGNDRNAAHTRRREAEEHLRTLNLM